MRVRHSRLMCLWVAALVASALVGCTSVVPTNGTGGRDGSPEPKGPGDCQAAPEPGDALGQGWNLLVDDHLIADKEGLTRTFHTMRKHLENPLMIADEPWEGAMVRFSGTVLRGEDGQGFRMWYQASTISPLHGRPTVLYATSDDGLTWTKPPLGLVEHDGSSLNNIVINRAHGASLCQVSYRPEAPADRRYLLTTFDTDGENTIGYSAAWSEDGVHFTDVGANPVLLEGANVGHFAWDPMGQEYVGYVKLPFTDGEGLRYRAVGRTTSPDGITWQQPTLVLTPDATDDRWTSAYTGDQRTHHYGLSSFAYGNTYLGNLWVFRATDADGYYDGKIHIELVSSTDGINWRRTDPARNPLIELGADGTWDDAMLFTATNPVRVGDEIWQYYNGCGGTLASNALDWNCAIGVATLRVDGYASLDAGSDQGQMTTVPLTDLDCGLRVNYQAETGGILSVEVLDATGAVVPGFAAEDCDPLGGDAVSAPVTWNGVGELPTQLEPLQFRFTLRNARLYSFWAGDGAH